MPDALYLAERLFEPLSLLVALLLCVYFVIHIRILSYMDWFPRAAITNYQQVSGLKQQKFVLSHVRRAEVQNQGVGRIGPF